MGENTTEKYHPTFPIIRKKKKRNRRKEERKITQKVGNEMTCICFFF